MARVLPWGSRESRVGMVAPTRGARPPRSASAALTLALVALTSCAPPASPSPSFRGSGTFTAGGFFNYYGPVTVTCDLSDPARARVEAHGRQPRPPDPKDRVDIVLTFDPSAREPFASPPRGSSAFALVVEQLGATRDSPHGFIRDGGAEGSLTARFLLPDQGPVQFTWRCP